MYRLHGAIHAYGGTTVSARDTADSVISALSPAAWYRNATDVVSSGGFASIWADYASSDKGLVLPGVASNNATTPDAAPVSFTGDIDIRLKVRLNDYTPTTFYSLCGKSAIANSGYEFRFNDGSTLSGGLQFLYGNGATLRTHTADAATGVTDGDETWLRVTRNKVAGVKFFKSTDGSAWTQIGSTIATTNEDMTDNADSFQMGARSTLATLGLMLRCSLYGTIDGTTPTFDADFSAQAIGTASFTESSSNAATVTINASGAAPAHIGKARDLLQGTGTNQPAYAAGVFTFDGADNYMKITADAAIIQPVTLYLVANPVSWTVNDRIFDGNTTSSGAMRQDTATPQVDIMNTAGSLPNSSDWTVGAYAIVCAVFNGASSVIRVNNAADVTGTVAADNMGGFTLCATGGATLHSNIAVKEVVLFLAAHDDTTRDSVITALNDLFTVF